MINNSSLNMFLINSKRPKSGAVVLDSCPKPGTTSNISRDAQLRKWTFLGGNPWNPWPVASGDTKSDMENGH
jgi:hypothetical protein